MGGEHKHPSAWEGNAAAVITVPMVTTAGAVTTVIKWLWQSRGAEWFRMLVGSARDAGLSRYGC